MLSVTAIEMLEALALRLHGDTPLTGDTLSYVIQDVIRDLEGKPNAEAPFTATDVIENGSKVEIAADFDETEKRAASLLCSRLVLRGPG